MAQQKWNASRASTKVQQGHWLARRRRERFCKFNDPVFSLWTRDEDRGTRQEIKRTERLSTCKDSVRGRAAKDSKMCCRPRMYCRGSPVSLRLTISSRERQDAPESRACCIHRSSLAAWDLPREEERRRRSMRRTELVWRGLRAGQVPDSAGNKNQSAITHRSLVKPIAVRFLCLRLHRPRYPPPRPPWPPQCTLLLLGRLPLHWPYVFLVYSCFNHTALCLFSRTPRRALQAR